MKLFAALAGAFSVFESNLFVAGYPSLYDDCDPPTDWVDGLQLTMPGSDAAVTGTWKTCRLRVYYAGEEISGIYIPGADHTITIESQTAVGYKLAASGGVLTSGNLEDQGTCGQGTIGANKFTKITATWEAPSSGAVAINSICASNTSAVYVRSKDLVPGAITDAPTAYPTAFPTKAPTFSTQTPTVEPTPYPSAFPTKIPTGIPTATPTIPSAYPTAFPSDYPTRDPTAIPTSPSAYPSAFPTASPTVPPTLAPTFDIQDCLLVPGHSTNVYLTQSARSTRCGLREGTECNTYAGCEKEVGSKTCLINPLCKFDFTEAPTEPTGAPTGTPTAPTAPTGYPTAFPTLAPTGTPTAAPYTSSPTGSPTTASPTASTQYPTEFPTLFPTAPTASPTEYPTAFPTSAPSGSPTAPVQPPTLYPTSFPTRNPSNTISGLTPCSGFDTEAGCCGSTRNKCSLMWQNTVDIGGGGDGIRCCFWYPGQGTCEEVNEAFVLADDPTLSPAAAEASFKEQCPGLKIW